MPADVTARPSPAAPLAAAGFCGKIPSRGDFVRVGLPGSFVDPWHDWMQRMLAASRACRGDDWISAWLEAPVWRFALRAGVCGPDAVLGLWLPSVDRVGRYFPLTIAALAADTDLSRLIGISGGFLAAAEDAGREALEDLPPGAVAARIDAAASAPGADPGVDPLPYGSARTMWWTEGAPRVAPHAFAGCGLPEAERFAVMLDGAAALPR